MRRLGAVQLDHVGIDASDHLVEFRVIGIDEKHNDLRLTARQVREAACGCHIDVAWTCGVEHEADVVGAAVECGSERCLGLQSADFHVDGHDLSQG